MAKTTNKGNKKEFAWDKETVVKEIEVNEYEKRVVTITELKGKQFVCVVTHKKIKDVFKPVKNATFPMDVWKQVVEAVGDFELHDAFKEAPVKVEKKEEPKPLRANKALAEALRVTKFRNGKNEGTVEKADNGNYIARAGTNVKGYKTYKGAFNFMVKNGYEEVK